MRLCGARLTDVWMPNTPQRTKQSSGVHRNLIGDLSWLFAASGAAFVLRTSHIKRPGGCALCTNQPGSTSRFSRSCAAPVRAPAHENTSPTRDTRLTNQRWPRSAVSRLTTIRRARGGHFFCSPSCYTSNRIPATGIGGAANSSLVGQRALRCRRISTLSGAARFPHHRTEEAAASTSHHTRGRKRSPLH